MNNLAKAKSIAEYLTQMRRTLHQHAELSFKEYQTTEIIVEELKRMGLDVTRWKDMTGAMGLIRGAQPGPTIGLRADIDALPIQEATGASYASLNPGVMHACAHDGHAAILLGVAKLLSETRSHMRGNVKFIFQPAEESPPGGALPLIERGVLENPKVDVMIACHHAVELPAGQIGIHSGQFLASADRFTLTVRCRGGGGSAPHKGVDGIAVAAQVITGLQYMMTRQINPINATVLSFGTIRGGVTFNVLADSVEMTGTCRALDPEIASQYPQLIRKVSEGIAEAFGAKIELKYEPGYPALVNDDRITTILEKAAKRALGPENVASATPLMAGDDLAYFLQKVPGTYFWLGVTNAEKGIVHPAHTSKFDIDESALPVGVAVMIETVEELSA
jgi:amidohydrolase